MNLYLINDYSIHNIDTDTIVQFANKEATVYSKHIQRSYTCGGNVIITFEQTGPMIYFEDMADCSVVITLIHEVEKAESLVKEPEE